MKIQTFTETLNEKKSNIEVFLGGTCAESTWRDKLIKKLKINN